MTAKDTREYFEKGCLCILTNRLAVSSTEPDEQAAERYMNKCKCSRNITEEPYDKELDALMRKEWKRNERREALIKMQKLWQESNPNGLMYDGVPVDGVEYQKLMRAEWERK